MVQIFQANTQEVDPGLIKNKKLKVGKVTIFYSKKKIFYSKNCKSNFYSNRKIVLFRLSVKFFANNVGCRCFQPRDYARGTGAADAARKELERFS